MNRRGKRRDPAQASRPATAAPAPKPAPTPAPETVPTPTPVAKSLTAELPLIATVLGLLTTAGQLFTNAGKFLTTHSAAVAALVATATAMLIGLGAPSLRKRLSGRGWIVAALVCFAVAYTGAGLGRTILVATGEISGSAPTDTDLSAPAPPARDQAATNVSASGGILWIQSAVANHCLDADITADVAAQVVAVQGWACNGQYQQVWVLDTSGTVKNYKYTQLCLDAGSGPIVPGVNPLLQRCVAGQTAQKWQVISNGAIKSQLSDLCLAMDPFQVGRNGSPVEFATCDESPSQKWFTQPVARVE